MKILEEYALTWLRRKTNISDESVQLVLEFAREVEKLMGIKEKSKHEKEN